MQGADKYCVLFPTPHRHGRLFLQPGQHARGHTFHVFLLPRDFESGPLTDDCIEVYGVVGGNPGWTETYGWIHDGPWVRDFNDLVAETRSQRAQQTQMAKAAAEEAAMREERRVMKLLEDYP